MTDNFFRFWYAFGFTNFSQLEDGDVDGVYNYVVEPALHQFASFSFEDICREFVKELQKKNALPFRYSKMGRWSGKTTVRDKDAPNGTRVAETEIDVLDTRVKLEPLQEKAKFYYVLFSESGFDEKIIEKAEQGDNISLYDLKQIVNMCKC